MRTIKFIDVLHGIATKLGDDPLDINFLTGRAVALTHYINAWVRKLWDSQDWPEWTSVAMLAPNPTTHLILYEPDPAATKIGRPFRVYLNNPDTTPGPLDTPFRLTEKGIHCGFEHGTNVWIKFIRFVPTYSSDVWNAVTRYRLNQVVLGSDGECYKSLVNNNLGIDPAGLTGQRPPPLPEEQPPPLVTDVTQDFTAAIPAVAGTSEQWRVQVDVNTWYNLAGTVYRLRFTDSVGVIHEALYTTPGAGGTIADVLNGLNAAVAAGDAFLISLTRAIELPNKIKFTLASAAFSVEGSVDHPGGLLAAALGHEHLSNYKAALAAVAAVPQKTSVFMKPDLATFPILYTVKITDSGSVVHTATYQAVVGDTLVEAMNGISAAINAAAATDAFWGTVVVNIDQTNNKFDLATSQITLVDVTAFQPVTSVLPWQIVPFPAVLAEPVMDGAYQEALREEGQTDKALAEAQTTAGDLALAAGKYASQTVDALTDQAR